MVVGYIEELSKLTNRELLLLIAGLSVVNNTLSNKNRIDMIKCTKGIEGK